MKPNKKLKRMIEAWRRGGQLKGHALRTVVRELMRPMMTKENK